MTLNQLSEISVGVSAGLAVGMEVFSCAQNNCEVAAIIPQDPPAHDYVLNARPMTQVMVHSSVLSTLATIS
jgi:hypothetical protein